MKKTVVTLLAALTMLVGGATATEASASTTAVGGISFAPIDEGGYGWNYVAGPVWMNGPYGYGTYCWYYHQWYGHAVFPC